MKIAFVLDDSLDKSDGVQQYILTLGKWLRSEGHIVHYLVGHTERTDIPNVFSLSKNIQVHFNQNRMSTPRPANKRDIALLLEQQQYDVLHVQMPFSPFLAGRIIQSAPPTTAVVGTFHIIPATRLESIATRLLRLMVRRPLKRFDAVFSVSEPAAKFARRTMGVRSRVIPNAVALSTFHSAKPLARLSDGKINIVFLGRLVERKGCMYLLQAIERLHSQKKLGNVRVIICGKGPLNHKLQEFVKANHLSHVVSFVGFVNEDQKARYLASAHLAALPSTGGESFGIVLVEAMAAGAEVVIGGDNIGYRTVLEGRKQQLIDPTDTKKFADSLAYFVRNHRARRDAQRWQAERAEKYNVNLIGKQLVDEYSQAVAKRINSGDN